MERFLSPLFLPHLQSIGAFGPSQFAYCPGRGARDAILVFLLTWLSALATGHRVAVYCSDVSGAFDKVSTHRLLGKLHASQLHPKILRLLSSWLEPRSAKVIIKGSFSSEIAMSDMVYQGTVFGPPLWNVFFADAKTAIEQ
eukprot:12973370-Alexandrium_andersonii.AAC.1